MKAFYRLFIIVFVTLVLFTSCPGSSGSQQVPAPSFSPAGGTFSTPPTVTINSSMNGVDIYYSTDSSNPLNNGELYSAPFIIERTSTLYAAATFPGWKDSEITHAYYTIEGTTPIGEMPTFSPAAGTYSGMVTVELTAREGSIIRYTTDDSTPTVDNGYTYSSAFTLMETTTIKAISYTDPSAPSNVATATYTISGAVATEKAVKGFWGSWTRMNNSEKWYIADTYVTVGGYSNYNISSSTTQTITLDSGIELTLIDDGILSFTEGDREYRLVRDRKMGSVSGTLLRQDSASASVSRGLSGLAGIGGIDVIITNINNPSNTDMVETDDEGVWTSDEVIPGETYNVTPKSDDVDLPSEYQEVQPMAVTAKENGEDMGSQVLTEEDYNFTTSYTQNDSFFYADGSTLYNLDLAVKNSGTQQNPGTYYELSTDAGNGLYVQCNSGNGTLNDILGTITPGQTKNLSLSVQCDEIENSWEDRKIYIQLTSADSSVATWEDSITIRFYKRKTTINLNSIQDVVNGFILTPEGKSINFATYNQGNIYSNSITLPYYTGFNFAFCGANLGSESKYSFGVDTDAEDYETLNAFYNSRAYEDNDTKAQSHTVATDDVVMSYLHVGDYDYFAINESKTAMPVFDVRGTRFDTTQTRLTRITCATDGASIYYTTDGSEPTTSSTPYSSGNYIPIDRTMTIRARAFYSTFEPSAITEEEYVFPSSVSLQLYERLIPADSFTTVTFSSEYDQWYMIEIDSGGSYSFTMSDASDGDGVNSLDLSVLLFDGDKQQLEGPVDNAYTTPAVWTMPAGSYFLMLSSKNGQASGSAKIKIVEGSN